MKYFQALGNVDIPRELLRPGFRLLDGVDGLHVGYGWDHRRPYDHIIAIYDSDTWHQDNRGNSPYMIVWTNVFPTEVLLPDGTIVTGKPNDVVLIRNEVVQHRTPPLFKDLIRQRRQPDRYFMRSWVPGMSRLEIVEKIPEWERELKQKSRIWNQ